jgi:hypothetical protein
MTVEPGDGDVIGTFWFRLLTSGEIIRERRFRDLCARLPHDPRCKLCNAPYTGLGGFSYEGFRQKTLELDPKYL